jgi:hypothetical protein
LVLVIYYTAKLLHKFWLEVAIWQENAFGKSFSFVVAIIFISNYHP